MKQRYKTILILLLAVVLIVAGVIDGQNEQVFEKAVRICMECIGIG